MKSRDNFFTFSPLIDRLLSSVFHSRLRPEPARLPPVHRARPRHHRRLQPPHRERHPGGRLRLRVPGGAGAGKQADQGQREAERST